MGWRIPVALLIVGAAALAIAEKRPQPEEQAQPQEERVRPPEARMRQPAHLPAAARMLLLERMGNHRMDMQRLQTAVLFLEHDTTRLLAEQIAREPRLAPPGPAGAEELNNLIPPAFFELQDELRQKAKRLAKAAGKEDDVAIAKAYGSLAETCVRCHAVYLAEP